MKPLDLDQFNTRNTRRRESRRRLALLARALLLLGWALYAFRNYYL